MPRADLVRGRGRGRGSISLHLPISPLYLPISPRRTGAVRLGRAPREGSRRDHATDAVRPSVFGGESEDLGLG